MTRPKTQVVRKQQPESEKARRQQCYRRKDSLFKKAYEYSLDCDADVYVCIRIRKNGRVFTLNSDCGEAWPMSDQKLVNYEEIRSLKMLTGAQDQYYPLPTRITAQDFTVLEQDEVEGHEQAVN